MQGSVHVGRLCRAHVPLLSFVTRGIYMGMRINPSQNPFPSLSLDPEEIVFMHGRPVCFKGNGKFRLLYECLRVILSSNLCVSLEDHWKPTCDLC